MTEYFEATDSDETWTIWANNPQFPEHPIAVVDEHQVADGFWPDVVARMTGTTIQADDATVETVAKAITPHYFTPAFGEHAREQAREAARNVLAALTGAPSEPVHRHYYVDISTFAAADAGRHNWLCECGATDETRDRA